MKNTATWLESTPTSFKMRIQFLPLNEVEAKRCSDLLLNPSLRIVSVTTQGPLSADVVFEAAPAVKPEPEPKPAAEGEVIQ